MVIDRFDPEAFWETLNVKHHTKGWAVLALFRTIRTPPASSVVTRCPGISRGIGFRTR